MAAYIFLSVITILSVFQIALVFGAPIGRFAWGGQHRILPRRLRIGSLLSIIIYAGFAVIIMSKSNVQEIIAKGPLLDALAWGIFGYLVLGVFMNAISRSKLARSNPCRHNLLK